MCLLDLYNIPKEDDPRVTSILVALFKFHHVMSFPIPHMTC